MEVAHIIQKRPNKMQYSCILYPVGSLALTAFYFIAHLCLAALMPFSHDPAAIAFRQIPPP